MRFSGKHLLLCLILLFAGVDVILSQTGNDRWEPMFQTGLSLLEQKQFAAAREQFEKILARNKNIAQAYYGLGLSYALEKPDSREALNQFKKAINIDENYAPAYYQSALVYINMKQFQDARGLLYTATRKDPTFVDAWLKLGEVEAEHGESSKAIEAYLKAFNNKPDSEDLYNRLVSSSIKLHEESKVIAYLEKLNGSADNHELRSDIAYLYFVSGDFDRSMSIVSTIPAHITNTRINLLQANLHFTNENNTAGLAYYWSAVNSIESEADAAALLRDSIYIMSNEEYARLLKTPTTEVWRFYYGFWRSRDPDPSTDENERIPEYYRRLSYARKSYRRTTKVDDRRFRLEHPLNDQIHLKVGSEMFADFLNDALQENRDLDDMGLIYIRHGQPDHTATDPDPALPQNVSWKFDEKWNRPELTFHFTKWGGDSGWIISSLPISFEGRWDLGGIYARLDPETPGYENLTYSELSNYYEQVDLDARAQASIAIRTESSDYQHAEIEPLQFPLHFVTFRGEEGKLLLEAYFGLSGEEALLKSTEEGTILALDEFFGFYDEDWNEVGKLRSESKIKVGLTPEQWRLSNIVDVRRFQITPGKHHFEVQMRDRVSGKMGIYKGEYYFEDLWSRDSLLVSDVILSGPITPAENTGKFVKDGIRYTPHMFSDFKMGEGIGLYFEIYNLAYNAEGQTNFRITCTLQPYGAGAAGSKNIIGFFKSLFDKEKEAVSTSYDYSGQTRNEKIYINFDLKGQDAGRYELVLNISDLQTGKTVRKRVGMKIQG